MPDTETGSQAIQDWTIETLTRMLRENDTRKNPAWEVTRLETPAGARMRELAEQSGDTYISLELGDGSQPEVKFHAGDPALERNPRRRLMQMYCDCPCCCACEDDCPFCGYEDGKWCSCTKCPDGPCDPKCEHMNCNAEMAALAEREIAARAAAKAARTQDGGSPEAT